MIDLERIWRWVKPALVLFLAIMLWHAAYDRGFAAAEAIDRAPDQALRAECSRLAENAYRIAVISRRILEQSAFTAALGWELGTDTTTGPAFVEVLHGRD